MLSLIVVPLTIGLLSTIHCLGMCGGIIGMLTLSLPTDIRQRRPDLLRYLMAYNIGRIVGYTLLGLLVGVLGKTLLQVIPAHQGRQVVVLISASMIMLAGLFMAGWYPRYGRIENLGSALWSWVNGLGRHILPVRSLGHALLFGLIWSLFPCGLIYSVLFWAAATGEALDGALTMLAFGIGTLPGVLLSGYFSGWLLWVSRLPHARQWAGMIVIAMGLFTLFNGLDHTHHAPHAPQKMDKPQERLTLEPLPHGPH